MVVARGGHPIDTLEFAGLRDTLAPVNWRLPAALIFTMDCDAAHVALPDAASCLDEEEHAQVQRMASPLRRQRMAVARAAMRQVLAACLDLTAAEVPLRRSASGRPFLDAQHGGVSLHLSAARSGSLAAIAISSGGRVGVDLEIVDGERFPERIAAEMLTPHEQGILAGVPIYRRPEWLATAWVGKEALLKGLGLGLQLDPRTISVMSDSGSQSACCDPYGGVALAGWEVTLRADNDVRVALALENTAHAARHARYWQFDFTPRPTRTSLARPSANFHS